MELCILPKLQMDESELPLALSNVIIGPPRLLQVLYICYCQPPFKACWHVTWFWRVENDSGGLVFTDWL